VAFSRVNFTFYLSLCAGLRSSEASDAIVTEGFDSLQSLIGIDSLRLNYWEYGILRLSVALICTDYLQF
jgi:hypothetical protein